MITCNMLKFKILECPIHSSPIHLSAVTHCCQPFLSEVSCVSGLLGPMTCRGSPTSAPISPQTQAALPNALAALPKPSSYALPLLCWLFLRRPSGGVHGATNGGGGRWVSRQGPAPMSTKHVIFHGSYIRSFHTISHLKRLVITKVCENQ